MCGIVCEGKTYWSRASGNWYSDIWTTIPGTSPVAGAIPGQNDSACLGLTKGAISISSAVNVYEYSQRAKEAHTYINEGATVHWFRYFGQRGRDAQAGYNGTVEMTGGTLHVKDRFIVAGYAHEDIGIGCFHQKGGVVTLEGALQLTQTARTGSPIATGYYSFSGGILNIPSSNLNACGIRSGIGKGKFEWTGGTLNCRYFFGNIHNATKGNLSPGGDGQIGISMLNAQDPKVYRQGSKASMTIDIASDTRYDRLFWQAAGKSEVTLRKGTTLKIFLQNGYRPKKGQTFDVIVADRLLLESGIVLGGPDGKDFSLSKVRYGSDRIVRLTYQGKDSSND